MSMKIFVKAKPYAKETSVQQIDSDHFLVSVPEPPIDGQANAVIERALAEYFKTAPGLVRIVAGHSAKQKIVEIR